MGFHIDRLCDFALDRLFTVLLCVVALAFFFSYSHLAASKQGKRVFRIGSVLLFLCVALMVGISVWSLPRGLPGSYYENPAWSGDPVRSLRYFETPGQRVDRFIDFHPNDFNDRYPFSGKPFSVRWQGNVYLPDDHYQLGTVSNFGAWLYVDDELIDGPHKIDFGTSEARTYLREGWSHDELWGQDAGLTFVWSSGDRSELYLGVDERTDYQLVFRCLPLSYPDSPAQELSIAVNGITLVPTVRLKEDWNTYTIPVPRSVIQDKAPGFFRIRFSYSHVIRPSEVLENSKDERQLAVAFDFAAMLRSPLEANNALMSAQDRRPSSSFSRGLHQLVLKAQSKGDNPFIQLVWKREGNGKAAVIPEDYLFPAGFPRHEIHQLLPVERSILAGTIVFKALLLVFLGSVLLIYLVFPYTHFDRLRKLITWEVLALLGIGLCAFGIRFLFLLEMKHNDPAFSILPHGTDQLNYVFFARGFFRGYWPGLSHQPFYFNVLMPFYYVVCAMVFGEGLLAIRMLSTVLATGSIFLTYLISGRVFNRPVAYIAALLCACNGILIFYDTTLLTAPLVTFLGLAVLWLMLKLKEHLRWQTTIALGGMLGLTALARANILFFMPIVFFWIIMDCPGHLWRKILHYLGVGLVMLLVIFPVTLRNYLSTDEHPFVLINSGGGVMLWIGNNPSSNGSFHYSSSLLSDTRKQMKETGTSFSDEIVRYIKEHPREYLRLEYTKLKMFWRGYEIGNLRPYYYTRQHYSRILKLPWFNFVVIGPLAIVGMILMVKQWRKLFILYGFVGVQMLTTLLFFALARYRVPAVPVLSMFAAVTLWDIAQRVQKKQWSQAGIVIGCVLLLYGIINYPYAAELYEQRYQTKMPITRVLRYWDIFHFHAE